MAHERQKRAVPDLLYTIAKAVLPTLGISQQNVLYYASLANFYTAYDLRRLRPEQTHLYLLCYVWLRYRQLTDNLVDALAYHLKQLEDTCSATAKKDSDADQIRRQQETPQVGRLLSLYVDDAEENMSEGAAHVYGQLQRAALGPSALPPSYRPYFGHHPVICAPYSERGVSNTNEGGIAYVSTCH